MFRLFDKFQKTLRVVFALVFMLFGIAFAGFGGFAMKNNHANDPNLIEIEAVVTESDGAMSLMKVKYEYGGKPFEVYYPGYDSLYVVNDPITIKIDPENPGELPDQASNLFYLIFVAAGAVAFLVGLFSLIRALREKAPEQVGEDSFAAAHDTAREAAFDPFADLTRDTAGGERNKYYFHRERTLKQGFRVENEARDIVYEIAMTKFSLFKPSDYTFSNLLSGVTRTVAIGNVVTRAGVSTAYPTPEASTFKINGQTDWDYLAERGWTFVSRADGFRPVYDLLHHGEKVAEVVTSGLNVYEEEDKGRLANFPVNGYFRIFCSEDDLDMAVLFAFCVSRSDLYGN